MARKIININFLAWWHKKAKTRKRSARVERVARRLRCRVIYTPFPFKIHRNDSPPLSLTLWLLKLSGVVASPPCWAFTLKRRARARGRFELRVLSYVCFLKSIWRMRATVGENILRALRRRNNNIYICSWKISRKWHLPPCGSCFVVGGLFNAQKEMPLLMRMQPLIDYLKFCHRESCRVVWYLLAWLLVFLRLGF